VIRRKIGNSDNERQQRGDEDQREPRRGVTDADVDRW
jgi:hypothetical protein